METKPHMVKQTITFSDGTETVINYRGVIENGVLIPDSVEVPEPQEEVIEEAVETVEAPADEVKEEPAE